METTVGFRPTLQSLVTEASEVRRFFRLSHIMKGFEKIFSSFCKTIKIVPNPHFIQIKPF